MTPAEIAARKPLAGDVWEWTQRDEVITRRVQRVTGGRTYYDASFSWHLESDLWLDRKLWRWMCERGGRLVKRGAPAGAEEVGND